MGRKPYQLIGKQFGRLIVISQAENHNGNTYWNCACSCGNTITVKGIHLIHNKTKSCGCLNRDLVVKRNKANADGKFRDRRLYRIYYGMRTRCYNKDDPGYSRYGKRGISVCEEWRDDFFAFQSWALSNGYDSKLSIDRIDNDGNYEPSNCQWVDNKAQSNNRSTNRSITYDGKTKTISQWAEETGISKNVIFARLRNGWSEKDAITIPNGQYQGGVNHSHLSVCTNT